MFIIKKTYRKTILFASTFISTAVAFFGLGGFHLRDEINENDLNLGELVKTYTPYNKAHADAISGDGGADGCADGADGCADGGADGGADGCCDGGAGCCSDGCDGGDSCP